MSFWERVNRPVKSPIIWLVICLLTGVLLYEVIVFGFARGS